MEVKKGNVCNTPRMSLGTTQMSLGIALLTNYTIVIWTVSIFPFMEYVTFSMCYNTKWCHIQIERTPEKVPNPNGWWNFHFQCNMMPMIDTHDFDNIHCGSYIFAVLVIVDFPVFVDLVSLVTQRSFGAFHRSPLWVMIMPPSVYDANDLIQLFFHLMKHCDLHRASCSLYWNMYLALGQKADHWYFDDRNYDDSSWRLDCGPGSVAGGIPGEMLFVGRIILEEIRCDTADTWLEWWWEKIECLRPLESWSWREDA